MRSVLLRGPLASRIGWQEGRLAETAELESVHDPEYVASIKAACDAGGRRFGSTTVLLRTLETATRGRRNGAGGCRCRDRR